MNVSRESLTKAGHKDPDAVFAAVAEAGGFGNVDPNHGGGLDISGLSGKEKADVEKILGKQKEPAEK
jgi:hypothetical protein